MKTTMALLLLWGATAGARGGVHFLAGPAADVFSKAKEEGRPVLIDFMTDWCRWCDTLDVNTYADADVQALLARSVVPYKVDAEKGEGVALARRYSVAAYPTVVLVDTDGLEIDRVAGYVPAESFLKTMKDFVRGVNTLGFFSREIDAHPGDPALRYAMAQKLAGRNDVRGAAIQYRRLLELDPNDSLGHNDEARLSIALDAWHEKNDPAPLTALVERHPESAPARAVLTTLFVRCIRTGDSTSAKRFFDLYHRRWPDDAGAMNTYAWDCALQGVNLESASGAADAAVALAHTIDEKAAYLDTYATVRFRLGRVDEAIRLEREALGLVKDEPAPARRGYETTLEKFRSAQRSNGAQ